MGSPKAKLALERLGQDIRNARLRRRITVADLALRSGTSPSSIARLEQGDPSVAIGTHADVLVVLGLLGRLSDLIDIRKDDLGLALTVVQGPRRGRSFATRLKIRRLRLRKTRIGGISHTLTGSPSDVKFCRSGCAWRRPDIGGPVAFPPYRAPPILDLRL
ncbi:helix-turn-helix domain-containing protein [Asticcacaulis excentricus]|uniref:Helix-turn-helix domain protein n=1 Tax=Asticcacaulis excentricus (strain ATCC 15261 / DSM 4724 / KCTC 12464 / NCIMB 9791 / VKM B-1370 / CB 48) TaxID=573065 RepID=E8RM81_ASTEC|nr:helix-turn-helix domain protein [Asticcacaulis excentricus CB 48]